jgi:nucleotide-binding universal stress UspA family protein
MSSIVVGVDGSPASIEALKFALAEARARGGEVKAVNVWHVPAIVYEGAWTAAPVDLNVYPKIADATIRTALEKAAAEATGVTVIPIVRKGHAADVLCEIAADADLLVVGSRGLGGFRGLLLGSVSQQCAHHAPCPVVIIPHSPEEEESIAA